MSWYDLGNPVVTELREKDEALLALMEPRNSAALVLAELPHRCPAVRVAAPGEAQRVWELAGLLHLTSGRTHEALAIFWALYQQMLAAQVDAAYVHKGLPLVWIAECFQRLGFPVHARRYLMLTLCEDAIRGQGIISPDNEGLYFRMVWGHGFRDAEVRRYAELFYKLAQKNREDSFFPEALLQRVDQDWLTSFPSATEASTSVASQRYSNKFN